MRLVPTRPPGRSTRKARGFADEMFELHRQGYTLEAIREALASAGVHVSKSTVQREMARCTARQTRAAAASAGSAIGGIPPRPPTTVAQPTTSAPQVTSGSADGRSGKDIAEAFVRNRITNPLIRSKEPR